MSPALRVQVFLELAYWDALNYSRAPDLSGGRGGMAWRSLRSLALPSFYAVYQILSLSSVPVKFPVHGAAGHNRWGVVETPLPVKTQGRNMDRSFKHVAGCLLMAAAQDEAGRRVPLAKCGRLSCLTQDMLALSVLALTLESTALPKGDARPSRRRSFVHL